MFVTDEADCSYNKDYSSIFEENGLRTFWSDPTSNFPTSAVCWNAGVECVGDPSNYDSCDPVNKDEAGNIGVDDASAVLHPINRYRGLLNGLELDKQALNADQEVIVGLIGGVSEDGMPFYADVTDTDPAFQDTFGIGPGCEAPPPNPGDDPVQAVPPVRIRALVDEFTEGNMFSICNPDYSDALAAIAEKVRDQIQPACYTKCVRDTDPATELVDPECTVEQDPPGNDNTETVPECTRDTEGYVIDESYGDLAMPSDDANVCYAMLTDDPDNPLTGTTTDDLSPNCADDNFNLEFRIVRRPGFPAPGGTSMSAVCSLADFPEVECPGIGG